MATIGNPWRKALLLLSVTCILLVFVNPYGVATGNLDIDPYSTVRREVTKTKYGKALLLSSFDDFYSIRSNFDLRREFGETHVERGYDKVLSAASLGDESFNAYLISKGVTHVLVPLSTSQRGEIRYKWGEMGSIRIQLTEPYFSLVTRTAGDFPVVLYKVIINDTSKNRGPDDTRYVLKWGDGVRNEFYQTLRSLKDKGMYSFEYGRTYENGLDINWVFSYPRSTDGLPDRQEIAEFQYLSRSPEMESVTAEVTLIAAYGPSAPTQIIRVIHNGESTAHTVTASRPAVVTLKLRNSDKVRFSNVLPCRLPQTFHAGDEDWRKYCFGISDIRVRLETHP
jgi:hypothetical protein